MLLELLNRPEGKTIEFKENTSSHLNIIKTVIAFANTAGGKLIIGVEDETKKVLGINRVLLEEERLSNVISDSIEPLLIPDIDIISHDDKELIIINVPYLAGPYYLKKSGLEKGVYIRLGSSNRLADIETISNLQRFAKNVSFDEMPCIGAKIDVLDQKYITKILLSAYKKIDKVHYKSIGLIASQNNKLFPSYGGILLFAKNRINWLPDSIIRCVCFSGTERTRIIDQKNIESPLIDAVEEVLAFVGRHTNLSSDMSSNARRTDVSQFPPIALREAVINAIVHADYTMKGSSIQIAIFSNRIEITNPGSLPFGQTMETALTGISRMRNRLIGRIFREIKLIEQLGTGLLRIINAYNNCLANSPIIEEIDCHFRVTLFEIPLQDEPKHLWEKQLLSVLSGGKKLSTKEIAVLWKVSSRAARARLKNMLDRNMIKRNAKSQNDPNAKYYS